jgi:rSAM/selenodomain-associated transferase 1
MKDTALIIFQKKPELGKVKTRLAATIGQAKAMEAYQLLLQHTHEQVSLVQCDVFVYFEKEIDPGFVRDRRYTAALQSSGDLGHKMKTALKEVFVQGHQKAIIIGSDCPDLDHEVLEEAVDQLSANDLVIGPAKDGGYYLIGMKELHDTLFENMPWSTAEVSLKTFAEANRLGLKTALLPELSDVDVYEDLGDDLKNKLGLV